MSRYEIKHRSAEYRQRTEKTERNSQICKMCREGNMSFEKIGERFGITMQAVSKIYKRDREKYQDN